MREQDIEEKVNKLFTVLQLLQCFGESFFLTEWGQNIPDFEVMMLCIAGPQSILEPGPFPWTNSSVTFFLGFVTILGIKKMALF